MKFVALLLAALAANLMLQALTLSAFLSAVMPFAR